MAQPRPFLSELQAAEILRGFEKEFRAFQYRVNGFSVWQLLRFTVGMHLQNLPLQRPSVRSRKKTLLDCLKGVLRILLLCVTGAKSAYWVKTHASALRFRVGESYWDVYFDGLLKHAPHGFKIQSPDATGRYRTQDRLAFIAPALNPSVIQVIGSLFARIFPVADPSDAFRSIAQLISNQLGLAHFDQKVVRRSYSYFYWQYRCYVLLLKLLKPKAIFVIDTGEFSLLAACRARGVMFVEMQHGIYTKNHPDALPGDALDFEPTLLLPTYLAAFGEYWKRILDRSALADSGRIRVVGNFMIDHYRHVRKNRFVAEPARLVITLTTQGLDRDNLIGFVAGFLEAHKADLILNIKLHPLYERSGDDYVRILGNDSRVRVIAGTSEPNTYELIACSDLHVSIASACHFDALGLGVPTVVIGLQGHELMDELIGEGDAVLAMNPVELSDIVQEGRWKPVSEEISEKYFTGNFVDNISRLARIDASRGG